MGRSGRETEDLVNQTDFSCHSGLCLDAVAATDHTHDLKALKGRGSCSHRLEAAGRSDHALERAVICLNDVVQVF
jgi:hypothetical protein